MDGKAGARMKRNDQASQMKPTACSLPSTIRVVDQLLQECNVFGRQACKPGAVNQTDIEQVTQVHSVFTAERTQAHSHEGF